MIMISMMSVILFLTLFACADLKDTGFRTQDLESFQHRLHEQIFVLFLMTFYERELMKLEDKKCRKF